LKVLDLIPLQVTEVIALREERVDIQSIMMPPYQILHVVSQSYFCGQGLSAFEVIDVLGLSHVRYPEYILGLCCIQVVKRIGLELFIDSFVMLVFDPAPSFQEFLTHIIVMTYNSENFGVFGE